MISLQESLELRIKREQQDLDQSVYLKLWSMASHHNSVITGLTLALKMVKEYK